ncbi:MAG: hypothetical protein C0467_14075 [Planctomycetaceae bacterium]|nr:hypothetical protein [Planctomycetaceae bacterium]
MFVLIQTEQHYRKAFILLLGMALLMALQYLALLIMQSIAQVVMTPAAAALAVVELSFQCMDMQSLVLVVAPIQFQQQRLPTQD